MQSLRFSPEHQKKKKVSWPAVEFFVFSVSGFFFLLLLCVGGGVCQPVWKSEDNSKELFLSVYLYVGCGVQTQVTRLALQASCHSPALTFKEGQTCSLFVLGEALQRYLVLDT